MKNIIKIIVMLTSTLLLASCIEESYTSEYYSSPSTTYYDSVTSGYNRDYNKPHHHKHDRGYYTSNTSRPAVVQPVQQDSGYRSSGSTDNNTHQSVESGYTSTSSTSEQPAETATTEKYKSTDSSESTTTQPAEDSGYSSSSSN